MSARHLRLDVAGVVEVALDEALAAAEGGDGLADRGVVEVGDLVEAAGDLEAATAAAERRLDGDRQAVLLGERHDLVGSRDRVGGAGHLRRSGPLGDVAGRHLVAEGADGRRRRPDPGEPGVDDGLREVGVLGEEAVAGVDRVRTGLAGGVQDLVDDEVALGRRRAAEGEGLVGEAHVQGVPVGVRVHRHGLEPGVLAGPDDADGDLAAVGDQDCMHVVRTLSVVASRDSRRTREAAYRL